MQRPYTDCGQWSSVFRSIASAKHEASSKAQNRFWVSLGKFSRTALVGRDSSKLSSVMSISVKSKQI